MKLLKYLYIWVVMIFVALMAYRNISTCCTVTTITEPEQLEALEEETPMSDWECFIEAIIWTESRGNENCIGDSGKAVGVLQIHPVMVREANRILKMKNIDVEYDYDDRYSKEKSIEIFNIIQDFHNKNHDYNRALQIWNKNHPESYRKQIMNKYNELIS